MTTLLPQQQNARRTLAVLVAGLLPLSAARSQRDLMLLDDDWDDDYVLQYEANLVSNGQTGLGLCEADCDYDSDCEGDLVCKQRDEYEDISGCTLSHSLWATAFDFCVQGDGLESFGLRLYWEQGYYWQEETIERKWCMSCKWDCEDGDEVAIYDCDEYEFTQWVFVPHQAGNLHNVMIKVKDREVCLEDTGGKDLELRSCVPDNPQQHFAAAPGSHLDDEAFEIAPRPKMDWCLTQRHHPKSGEGVNIETCEVARKSDTSYWSRVW